MKEPATHNRRPTILLTIDVEDWFQVENFKPWIPFSTWGRRELRVERNVHRLLDLFDSFGKSRMSEGRGRTTDDRGQRSDASFNHSTIQQINPSTHQPRVRATFFILGWIAKRLPGMVREIHDRGHEVGSHGVDHDLPKAMPKKQLQADLSSSRNRLEDIIGAPVYGYRAPSFSIDDQILGLIREAGYRYDSSYNSFSLHGRYGRIHLNGDVRNGGVIKIKEDFFEIPVSNLTVFSRVLPWGGGAYFRLLPFPAFALGARRILKQTGVYTMYLHPWEVDPGQPRVAAASAQRKFRHYTNLARTRGRLEHFIHAFSGANFRTGREHVAANRAPEKQPAGVH